MPRKYLGYFTALILLDQLTKYLVRTAFTVGEVLPLTSFFQFTYVTNTGISFGLFKGANRVFALLGSALIVGLFVWYHTQYRLLSVWMRRAVLLILSGATGNVIDRLFHGHVIDFLEFHLGTHYWPAFNVADSCITIGGVILFCSLFFAPRPALSPGTNDSH